MAVELLGWANVIINALSKITDLLKTNPNARKRKIAQRLATLHNHIADIVSNGRTIISTLKEMPDYGSIEGVNLAYQLYEPPFDEMKLVSASPAPEKLENLISLLTLQENSLKAIVKILESSELRNLGILFESLPFLEVAVIDKFGTVNVLLSSLSKENRLPSQLPDNLASTAQIHLQERQYDLKKPDYRRPRMDIPGFPPWISNFRPSTCTDYSRYLLVYSQAEVDAGNARLDTLAKANSALKNFIQETFNIEDIS